jgi:hypothetical protein
VLPEDHQSAVRPADHQSAMRPEDDFSVGREEVSRTVGAVAMEIGTMDFGTIIIGTQVSGDPIGGGGDGMATHITIPTATDTTPTIMTTPVIIPMVQRTATIPANRDR